jgi:hypothetical protein
VFTFAFVAFELIRGFARRFARASEIEFLICNLLFAFVLAVLVRKMILSAAYFQQPFGGYLFCNCVVLFCRFDERA